MKTFQEVIDYLFDPRWEVTEETAAANTMTPEEALLKELGIIVLGSPVGSDSAVHCYSRTLGKQAEIRDIGRLRREHLILNFGIGKFINDSREPIPGRYTVARIRDAIATEAASRSFNLKDRRGGGPWLMGDTLVLVNAEDAVLVNGGLERVRVPSVDGHLVEFRSVEPWFDFEMLQRNYEQSLDPKWCEGVLDELKALFARWDNWAHNCDAQLVAGLVLCTWLQTIWDWPHSLR